MLQLEWLLSQQQLIQSLLAIHKLARLTMSISLLLNPHKPFYLLALLLTSRKWTMNNGQKTRPKKQ